MYKRLVRIILVPLISLLALVSGPHTVTRAYAVSAISSVLLDNSYIGSPGVAANVCGVAMMPAKELMESLGGSFAYDGSTKTAVAKTSEREMVMRLDDPVMKYDGRYVTAPAAFGIVNLRFMVPADFILRKFGATTFISADGALLMAFRPVNGLLAYKVRQGDTLAALSQIFGVSVSQLKQQNSLSSDMIYTGQMLAVKKLEEATSPFPAWTTDAACIRTGAGMDYRIAASVPAWTSVSVIGKSGNWYKVVTSKYTGYVYNSLVSFTQDTVDKASDSAFFNVKIPVDTAGDSVSYMKYTVVKGDYMWALSEKFGVPDYELASANGMTAGTVLYPGQVMRIPVHQIAVKKSYGYPYGEVLDWFSEAQYIFPINKTGKLTDLATGRSFMVRRTMGANHSDTETVSAADSQVMKEIFGGSWTWTRRPFTLEVDGRRFAVSVAGMPHDGVDGVAYLQNVDNRSDDYGYGPNYDRIPGNGMNGHFDLYFLNCLRHVDNKIDPAHQFGVLAAGGLR